MLLRGLILLPPSQVCCGDSDNTRLALEADYQGQMTGVRGASAPIAVIDSSTIDNARTSFPEKHGAAVRFVAPLLRVNAVITFRAEARVKQVVGGGRDLLKTENSHIEARDSFGKGKFPPVPAQDLRIHVRIPLGLDVRVGQDVIGSDTE